MIGKPLSALEDARAAVKLDAKFIRAVVRVATCYLRQVVSLGGVGGF